MSEFHLDDECNEAFRKLFEALMNWERRTHRRSLLVFVPETNDERLLVADSGIVLDLERIRATPEIIAGRVHDTILDCSPLFAAP